MPQEIKVLVNGRLTIGRPLLNYPPDKPVKVLLSQMGNIALFTSLEKIREAEREHKPVRL